MTALSLLLSLFQLSEAAHLSQRPALSPDAGLPQPSPGPAVDDKDGSTSAAAWWDEDWSVVPTTPYMHAYTDYQCLVLEDAQHTGCAISKKNPATELRAQLRKMPRNAHLLFYGPSYLREVANAVIRAGGDPVRAASLQPSPLWLSLPPDC